MITSELRIVPEVGMGVFVGLAWLHHILEALALANKLTDGIVFLLQRPLQVLYHLSLLLGQLLDADLVKLGFARVVFSLGIVLPSHILVPVGLGLPRLVLFLQPEGHAVVPHILALFQVPLPIDLHSPVVAISA